MNYIKLHIKLRLLKVNKKIMNNTKKISEIRKQLTDELEGGFEDPVAGQRLLKLAQKLKRIAMSVYANEIQDSLPSNAYSIKWVGTYGEDDEGYRNVIIDDVEVVFKVNGIPHGLPLFTDYFDYGSADLSLISNLSGVLISNIEDAEVAMNKLDSDDGVLSKVNPAAIEDFCALSFKTADAEEWVFLK